MGCCFSAPSDMDITSHPSSNENTAKGGTMFVETNLRVGPPDVRSV